MRLSLTLTASILVATLAGASSALTPVVARGPAPDLSVAGAQQRTLRMCVDQFNTSVSLSRARERLARVMRTHVEQHPRFAVAGFSAGNWILSEGCPQGPALLTSGEKHPKNGGNPLTFPVDVPSGYRTFIFIVPQVEIDRMFGELPYQIAVQEHVCGKDDCATVANAWYLSAETLGQAGEPGPNNAVARGLILGIGLEPPLPPSPREEPQSK